jgi:hypothetical protein
LSVARGLIVVGAALAYLSSLFQLTNEVFWTTGLGDWIDPYFINFLLEHWYSSVRHFTDPTSPPIFFPTRGTLGYSHGLVLFAPYYILLRPFLHAFQAYSLTLLLVMLTGILCLYGLFRKFLALSSVESFLLTAFVATSANIVNGILGVWSQRASVFLIPAILLLTLASARMRDGRPRLVLAALSGLLATGLFVQDFYTAQFALLLVILASAAALIIERPPMPRSVTDVCRPWPIAYAAGALAGAVAFLWIYLPIYRAHPAFPESELLNQLVERNPYDSWRSFILVFGCAVLAWIPWFRVERKTRLYVLSFALISLLVLVLPVRFGSFSIWRAVFEPLPGFTAIRDPKRVIYLYELAVVLATGLFLSRLGRKSPLRILVSLVLLVLMVRDPNRTVFDFLRPNDTYARWVDAPIAIDPSCQSFFIKAASGEYAARQPEMRPVYATDSAFVAVNHVIPTLNGYSAWAPPEWNLPDPADPSYRDSVMAWIEQRRLSGVCEFDIEKRTMRPF